VLGDTITAGGKALKVEATGEHAVAITFPEPFAPGIRILDSLPILPRHKLEGALKAGTLRKAWGLQTPVADVVGLGPFVISAYQPGQRLKRAADAGRVKLLDLGVSRNADGLWMNLKPGAFAGDPRAAWLQRDELRRAISMAVDRQAFADTVFLGAGVPVYGAETPANKVWYWTGTPQTPHDPAAARQLLATIGLTDRDGNGTLEDAAGHPAQFTLITQKGRASLERAATVIREEMKKIGVVVDVVTLDSSQVVQRFLAGQYDAVYYNATKTDLDPGTNQDFWLSSGSAHPWNVEQKTPATEWERQIDELMVRQIASRDEAERKRLYDEVQKIFCEHLPMVFFVAPRIYAASSARVLNVTPSDARPQLLWRPEVVAVAH
jgi:peptide/nickel transport system substrate-binding protein